MTMTKAALLPVSISVLLLLVLRLDGCNALLPPSMRTYSSGGVGEGGHLYESPLSTRDNVTRTRSSASPSTSSTVVKASTVGHVPTSHADMSNIINIDGLGDDATITTVLQLPLRNDAHAHVDTHANGHAVATADRSSAPSVQVATLSQPVEHSMHQHHRQHQAQQQVSQKQASRFDSKTRFIIALSSLSGILEGICYRRFGCFPNMMTGNSVRCMSFLADGNLPQALFFASMIASYVLGGSCFHTVDTKTRQHPPRKLRTVGAIAFGFFALADLVSKRFHAAVPKIMLIPLALAYGFTNAAGLKAAGAVVTNAITGHYTKLGLGFAERMLLLASNDDDDDKLRTNGKALSTSLSMVLPFCASIVVSGWLYKAFMTLPVTSLLRRMAPPMATTFGCAYALLLSWYGKQLAAGVSS